MPAFPFWLWRRDVLVVTDMVSGSYLCSGPIGVDLGSRKQVVVALQATSYINPSRVLQAIRLFSLSDYILFESKFLSSRKRRDETSKNHLYKFMKFTLDLDSGMTFF